MSIRQTRCGLIRGVPGRLPGVEIFKGVPFAQPPKGALHLPPQPPKNGTVFTKPTGMPPLPGSSSLTRIRFMAMNFIGITTLYATKTAYT